MGESTTWEREKVCMRLETRGYKWPEGLLKSTLKSPSNKKLQNEDTENKPSHKLSKMSAQVEGGV